MAWIIHEFFWVAIFNQAGLSYVSQEEEME
jgi:hypothetical protein